VTAGWVAAFDESFKRVPASRMGEAYAAGMRVLGGYAGGGSAGKQPPRAEIDAWLSRPGTGVAGLFEIFGTEPIDNPSSGTAHAKSARSAWRALGYPDHAAIFVAVDRNVTVTQARAQLTTYFRAWAGADTCLPVAYVEADAGAVLVAEGVTQGTFTPAAYAWNDPPVLYAPNNAPSHVIWTQEHNGQGLYGGDLDIGHIRSTAPIWWADGRLGDTGVVDMSITQADADLIAETIAAKKIFVRPAGEQSDAGLSFAWAARGAYLRAGQVANVDDIADANRDAAILAGQTDEAAAIAALSTKLDGVPAAVVAQLPVIAGGQPGFTEEQLAQVETAAQSALAHLGLVVTP
jgi:Rv2525c-like, glycoside hydrolase-like domain